MPVLNVPVNSSRFQFQVKHTTQSYDIKADVTLDVVSNTIVFTLPNGSDFPYLDQRVARQAFIELKPYFDLHCSNKKCKNKYSLASYYMFGIDKIPDSSAWTIAPLKLFIESFVTNNHVVQNDWFRETTIIYSKTNEDSEPIKVPFMNFEEMDKDKLLNRISTLVTFS